MDIAIALDHLTLAAVAEGLGTCWIGAFIEREVKELINAPADAKIVALTPLGYPTDPGLIRPVSPDKRKSPEQIFYREKLS